MRAGKTIARGTAPASGALLGRGKNSPVGLICTTFKVSLQHIDTQHMFVRKRRLTSFLFLNSMKLTNGVKDSSKIYISQKFSNPEERSNNQLLVNRLCTHEVVAYLMKVPRIHYFFIHKGYLTLIVPGIISKKNEFIDALNVVSQAYKNVETTRFINHKEVVHENKYTMQLEALLNGLYSFDISKLKPRLAQGLYTELATEAAIPSNANKRMGAPHSASYSAAPMDT